MKTIVESIIGRRGSNKKLYIVSPKGSDNYLYWNSKFTYNGVADSRGYFYFVLTKDELQKFLPQEPDTSIYLVDDDTVDYKKLEQDVEKTKDLLNNPLIYLKKVDVMSISESIIGRKGVPKENGTVWGMLSPLFDPHVETTHDINHLVYIFTAPIMKVKKTYTNIFNIMCDAITLFRHSAYLFPTAACAEKDYLYVLNEVSVNLNVIRDGRIAGSWTESIQRLEERKEVSSKLKKISRKLIDFDLSGINEIAFRYYFDNKKQPMTLEMINIDIAI